MPMIYPRRSGEESATLHSNAPWINWVGEPRVGLSRLQLQMENPGSVVGLFIPGLHPAVHDGLRAAGAAQVLGIRVM